MDETQLCTWEAKPLDDAVSLLVESCFGETIDWIMSVEEAIRVAGDLIGAARAADESA